MRRAVFLVFFVITVFGLYHCAAQAPATSRYRDLLTEALAKDLDANNPLCADIFPPAVFPFLAALDHSGSRMAVPASVGAGGVAPTADTPKLPPENPLRFKWRDLVKTGVLYESEHYDANLKLDGYVYELSPKGRSLYGEHKLRNGETRGRFCLGKPQVKEVQGIGRPADSLAGLEVPVRFVLKIDPVPPGLYDGTAEALGLTVPKRALSGEVLYPVTDAIMTLDRESGKVLYVEPR